MSIYDSIRLGDLVLEPVGIFGGDSVTVTLTATEPQLAAPYSSEGGGATVEIPVRLWESAQRAAAVLPHEAGS